MTVEELKQVCRSPLMVKSGYNGKILCKVYDSKKHCDTIGKCEVTAVWGEMNIFGCYVYGDIEANEEV